MSTALSGATIDTAGPASPQGRRPGRAKRSTPRNTLTPGAGLGLGIAMLWFSLLVLVPLSAIVATAAAGGWENYFDVLRNDQTWAALMLTVSPGRDRHPAQHRDGHRHRVGAGPRPSSRASRVLNVIIDVPFAMPTIVAGLVLLALYGPNSPLGLHWAFTPDVGHCWPSRS